MTLRDQLDQIARLDKACGSGEGEWRGGIVGNCNLVAYNGEDAVGIALVPYGPRIEFIAALVNLYRSGGRELALKGLQAEAMKLKLSKETLEQLKWLAANYYVVKGKKPCPLEEVVSRMVEREFNDANPREYAPFYERR